MSPTAPCVAKHGVVRVRRLVRHILRAAVLDVCGAVQLERLHSGAAAVLRRLAVALAAGNGEGTLMLTWLEKVALAVEVGGCCISSIMFALALGSEDMGTLFAIALLPLSSIMLLFKALDRRDGGGRLALYLALVGKWFMGAGVLNVGILFLHD